MSYENDRQPQRRQTAAERSYQERAARQRRTGETQARSAGQSQTQLKGYDQRATQGQASSQYDNSRQRQQYASSQQRLQYASGQQRQYAGGQQRAPYDGNRQRAQYGATARSTQGRAGAAGVASPYNDYARYTSAGGYNSLYDPRNNAPAKKSKAPLVIGIIVAVLAIAALVWFFIIPKPFEVTVNGKEVTMKPGSTVATLVEEGYAKPSPGNLLAVDGTLITTGEGEPFSATVNGSPVATDAALSKDMVVEIGDGGDKTEDYTTAEEVIPFGSVNDDMSFEAYWAGSIHAMQDGQDGLQTTKTGTISGKKVSEVTKPAVDGGYHNYTVQTSEPVIALTFDDGPWPETTHEILDILEANGAKATFFTIGNQISSYADAVQRANNMGCEVCTHTWDHADGSGQGVDLTLMSADEQIWEVTQGYAAIASAIGKEPVHLLRAPGGNFHDEIINTLWPYLDAEIGWDVDTEDWARPGVDAIVSRILSVEPGQVILMHDGGGEREQTVEALRQALPELVKRGYKCVTVSELLTYDQSNMQAATSAEQV